MVTVDSVKNNRYGITYGILDNNASEWYNSLVQRCLNNSEKQCLLFVTGQGGGRRQCGGIVD